MQIQTIPRVSILIAMAAFHTTAELYKSIARTSFPYIHFLTTKHVCLIRLHIKQMSEQDQIRNRTVDSNFLLFEMRILPWACYALQRIEWMDVMLLCSHGHAIHQQWRLCFQQAPIHQLVTTSLVSSSLKACGTETCFWQMTHVRCYKEDLGSVLRGIILSGIILWWL